MRRLMVDTSAWIALYHAGDRHHARALELLPRLGRTQRLTTTTHFVLETHKRLRHDPRVRREAPERFLARCRAGDLAEVVSPEALTPFDALLEAHASAPPGVSLEDLAGVLTMRTLGIRRIWAWDEDFRRLGVEVVPAQ